MRPVTRTILAAAFALGAVPAAAQVTAFNVESRTNEDGSLVANVLSVDFDGLYVGSQVLLELDSGFVRNVEPFDVPPPRPGDSPYSFNGPPSMSLVQAFPHLAFDTYLAQGDRFSDGPGAAGNPGFGGGAVNLDHTEAVAVFNDALKISQAWSVVATHTPKLSNQDKFVVAQLTFSSDANGTFSYFGVAALEFFYTREGNTMDGADLYHIRNGRIVPVPEPAVGTMLLSALALRRRRR